MKRLNQLMLVMFASSMLVSQISIAAIATSGGTSPQQPSGTTTTQQGGTPVEPLKTYKSSSGMAIPSLPANVKRKSISTQTQSMTATTTGSTSTFQNMPRCNQQTLNCRNINNVLENPAIPEYCPDVCKISRIVDGVELATPTNASSVKEALCPTGYAQIGSYNVQPEYSSTPIPGGWMPWPIPDMDTYYSYVNAGYQCSASDDVFADNIFARCGGDWADATTQNYPLISDQCMTWKWNQNDGWRCDRWMALHGGFYAFIQAVYQYGTSPRLWNGTSNNGRPYYGVGQISTDFPCALTKNQGTNNVVGGGRFAGNDLCRREWDYMYFVVENQPHHYTPYGVYGSINASNYISTPAKPSGCYATWSNCTYDGVSCGVAHKRRFDVVVVYTKCYRPPSSGLVQTGRFINATLVCGRVKSSWSN